MSRRREVALQVHGDHRVPLTLGHVDDHPVAQDPRVVDEDVQVAVRVDGLPDEPFRAVPIGDVLAIHDGVTAHGLDLFDDLHRGTRVTAFAVHVAAEVVDHDLGAFGGEQQRVLTAETARRTGDDRNPSVECTHPSSP